MKTKLLRSLLALVLLAFTIIAISCADKHEMGAGGGVTKGKKTPVEYGYVGTRARFKSFPLDLGPKSSDLADLNQILSKYDKKLYKVRVFRAGVSDPPMGSLSTTSQPGQSAPDLDPAFETGAIDFAKVTPPLNGVAVQAGRGRGGVATMNPDKALVAELKAFFDSH